MILQHTAFDTLLGVFQRLWRSEVKKTAGYPTFMQTIDMHPTDYANKAMRLIMQMIDMDLNDDAEKKVVEGVFWNAVDILSEQDRRLPHIHAILPMLKRGVGVHHSGLLPILKEVIEILFQEGLIKVSN